MFKNVLFLLFVCGIKNGSSSSSSPQEQTLESKAVSANGIKKNEVGANGAEANWEKVARNFRNPVLEYLLGENSERTKGVVREIQHGQRPLLPNLPGVFMNRLPLMDPQGKPSPDNLSSLPRNKTRKGGAGKVQERVVSSPVLHLNKNSQGGKESTRIQTFPAVAVVINTFDKDGSLKSSLTHFHPDFNSLGAAQNKKEVTHVLGGKNADKNHKNDGRNPAGAVRQWIFWPFAGYFPIVVNDPFLSAYNAFGTSMSSMVEYGPEADISSKEKGGERQEGKMSPVVRYRSEPTETDSNIFDEITMESGNFDRSNRRRSSGARRRREATSIFVKSREGDTVEVTLEEPNGPIGAALSAPDERARSFGPTLVNTPPLSTILRPPQQEPRQFLGYADKKRKTKPTKPIKEEGSSEEIGEEHEEESTGPSQESANEAVAISPPPEGASVAEAKPIGLAIAGPGGVAASKPQGTAVAGPGGLAIARPVGTAIAGVDVEGSVPIGGQQKNKKKPKQEQDQTEAELHYVGGLTGPIGNPQPKEFADSIYYKTVKDTEGNNIQENLFFRGRPTANFQLKLGQQNGKYGFVPMGATFGEGKGISQRRTDFPTFFHGLLGNGGQGFDQFQNYPGQF